MTYSSLAGDEKPDLTSGFYAGAALVQLNTVL